MDVLSHILGIPKIGGGGGVELTYNEKELATTPSNILAYWKLDEISGTTVLDSSGNGRNGTSSNLTLNYLPFLDTQPAPLFTVGSSFVNVYSSSLAAAFDGTEGTLRIAFRVADGASWFDGVDAYIFRIRRNSSNLMFARQTMTDSTISIGYTAGGVAKTLTISGISNFVDISGWIILTVVWKNKDGDDYLRAYLNGVERGTPQTGLGTWLNGSLDGSTMIGASSTTPADVFPGSIARVSLRNIALSAEQVAYLDTIPEVAGEFVNVSNRVLWESSDPAQDWQGRPVLIDDDDLWMTMYRVASQHTPDTNTELHARFSQSEGANWTDANVYVDSEACVGLPLIEQVAGKALTEVTLIPCPNGDYIALSFERPGGGTSQWRSTDRGKTWSYEGIVNSDTTLFPEDYEIVGSTIYVPFRITPPDFSHPHFIDLYKSDDNGATWVLVAAIEDTLDCNEVGIISLGGNNLMVIVRDENARSTYKYTSSDLGETWSARSSVSIWTGILQRPRMKRFGGRYFLYGRNGYDGTTVVFVSDDGDTWSLPFYPTLAGTGTESGYCDIVQRDNGHYYMQNYHGTMSVAAVVESVFRDA